MDYTKCLRLIQKHVSVMESLYEKFNDFFYSRENVFCFNLKKTSIDTLSGNLSMLQTTMDYRSQLVLWTPMDAAFYPLVAADWGQHPFYYRTKMEDSFIKKLTWYLGRDQPYYVYKAFNDFLGARLIIPNFREVEQEVLDYYEQGGDNMVVRSYIRDDSPHYHGLHLYIGSGNTRFLWELQIWDSVDEEPNLTSHATHERRKEGE